MHLHKLEISSISSQENIVENIICKPFRTIHYLGSKLRLLEFIKNVADEADPNRGAICDLFAGSGAVSQYLSKDRRVVSVDIQKYSQIICNALLNPCSDKNILKYGDYSRASTIKNSLEKSLKSIIDYEIEVIKNGAVGDLEPVCDFLENGSLYGAIVDFPAQGAEGLKVALSETINNLKYFESVTLLATRYFGGIYYSYKQAVNIDVILYEIEQAPMELRNTLMAALLSTASDLVNTVGKQFAQPIRPRNKSGEPKAKLIQQLNKDRELCVFDTFESWLHKYIGVNNSTHAHEVLCMDYNVALDLLPEDVSIVYADPPYTRDHYSRFYHGLETICRNDFPEISKTNIGGTIRLSRGLYRDNRHQSAFCIKSQAPDAFSNLFKKVAQKGKTLMLSYSPYEKDNNAHPRVMQLDDLLSLAKQHFKNTKSYSPGVFLHSKLNHTEKHLKASDNGELILVCSN
ncbi:MAG: DNA methyltransferase [Methylococcaceae bacterium]|nr:DNA methyltransferase [Methylococcaceae bacterium]